MRSRRGPEMPSTSHADGVETSVTLYFYPEAVRPGYERLPVSPSSVFREVLRTGDRSKNPSGTGGFPFDKASAAVGKEIIEKYRIPQIGRHDAAGAASEVTTGCVVRHWNRFF